MGPDNHLNADYRLRIFLSKPVHPQILKEPSYFTTLAEIVHPTRCSLCGRPQTYRHQTLLKQRFSVKIMGLIPSFVPTIVLQKLLAALDSSLLLSSEKKALLKKQAPFFDEPSQKKLLEELSAEALFAKIHLAEAINLEALELPLRQAEHATRNTKEAHEQTQGLTGLETLLAHL